MTTETTDNFTTGTTTDVAEQAAQSASGTIRSTQALAQGLLNRVADKAQVAREQAAPAIDRLADGLDSAARRSIDAVRDQSARVREQAHKASDLTVNYIQQEPLKAMLAAAATGAILMALIGLLGRSRSDA